MSEEWIHTEDEFAQSAGWSTLGYLVSSTPNKDLNISDSKKKLDFIEKTCIHQKTEFVML